MRHIPFVLMSPRASPGDLRLTRRALTALAVLAASATVTACGDSVQQRQARYITRLQAIDTSLQASVRALLSGITAAAPRARVARAVGRFEVQLANVETRLRALRAPAPVARGHRHLVRVIDRYAGELRLEVKALRSGDADTLARAGRRMLNATLLLSADVHRSVAALRRVLVAPAPSPA